MDKRHIFAIFLLLSAFTISAQNVSNVNARQIGKGTIEITYDLDKAANITVLVSTSSDDGFFELEKVTGDVGRTVGPGHKTVVWNVLAEMEELVGNDIAFMVRVESSAEAAWKKQLRKEEKESKKEDKAIIIKEKKEKREAKREDKAMKVKEKKEKKEAEKESNAIKIKEKNEVKGEKDVKEKIEEKEVKAKEDKLPVPYNTFFTLNTAWSPLPQWSYGFKIGGMKRVGWYVNLMTNFNVRGWGNYFSEGEEYYLTGMNKTIRFSAQAGLVYRPCKPVSILLGVGYGYRALTFCVNYNYHNGTYDWRSYPSRTYNGIDVSFGLMFDIKGVLFSAEAVSTNFQTIEARVGVGYCLPHK